MDEMMLQQTLNNFARIDERTEMLGDALDKTIDKLERLGDSLDKLEARLAVVEAGNGHKTQELILRVAELEFAGRRNDKQWDRWADHAWKVLTTIVAAVILWKVFGIAH